LRPELGMAEKTTSVRGLGDFRWLIKVLREMELEGDRHDWVSTDDKTSRGKPRTPRKHGRSPRGAAGAALR
jgi:hypothetical protein